MSKNWPIRKINQNISHDHDMERLLVDCVIELLHLCLKKNENTNKFIEPPNYMQKGKNDNSQYIFKKPTLDNE